MIKVHIVFKSGNHFYFKCKTYNLEKSTMTGDLIRFSYNGVEGECPIFFRTEDVELIAIETEGDNE